MMVSQFLYILLYSVFSPIYTALSLVSYLTYIRTETMFFFVTDNLPFLGTLPNNKRVKFRTYLNVPFFNKEKFGFFSDTYLPLGSKSLSLLFFLEVVPYAF